MLVPATGPIPHSVGAGLLRISVKEVGAAAEEAGLGEPSLVAGGVWGSHCRLVLSTVLLTLRVRAGPALTLLPCPTLRPARQDQECQVSMLPAVPSASDLPPRA